MEQVRAIWIKDPFYPQVKENVESCDLQFSEGMTVGDVISRMNPVMPEGCSFLVRVNGAEKGVDFCVSAYDVVIFVIIPEGGGDLLKLVGMLAVVALSIAVPQLAPASWGLMSGGALTPLGMAVSGGIMIGGSMLLNAVLPPTMPDVTGSSGSLDESPTYGWTDVGNIDAEGTPLPYIVGSKRVTPPLINQYIETIDNKQYLYMLFALANGEIVADSNNVWLNNTALFNSDDIRQIEGVEIETRPGTTDQTAIPWFDITWSQQNVNYTLPRGATNETTINAGLTTDVWSSIYNTGSATDSFNVLIEAPDGLSTRITTCHESPNAGLVCHTKTVSDPGTLEISYRAQGSSTWTTVSKAIEGELTGRSWFGIPQTESLEQPFVKTYTFDGLAANTYEVRVKLTSTHGQPVRFKSLNSCPLTAVKTTTGNSVSAVEAVLVFNALYYMNDKGNLENTSVKIAAEYCVHGTSNWRGETRTITRATQQPVRISFMFKDLPAAQYDMRVYYVDEPATSTRIQNQAVWSMMQEGVSTEDFSYPGTALLGVKALATDQFSGSRPTVEYEISSLVKYGTEDFIGGNPAKETVRFLQHYGIPAERISSNFDDWSDFCDNPPAEAYNASQIYRKNETCSYNGHTYYSLQAGFSGHAPSGTNEPNAYWHRFVLYANLYIDQGLSFRQALDQISLPGRGKVVQRGVMWDVMWEHETDRVDIVTSGNMIEKSFKETFLSSEDYANICEVTYFPDEAGRTVAELRAPDFDSSEQDKPSSIVLYGVTNRIQALQHGTLVLNSTRLMTRVCSWEQSTDSIRWQVGDVVGVQSNQTPWTQGGRLVSATSTGCVIDRADLAGLSAPKIIVRHTDGTIETQNVDTITADTPEVGQSTVALEGTWTTTPAQFDIYNIGPTEEVIKDFRVSSITSASDVNREITAIEYNEDIYDADTVLVVEASEYGFIKLENLNLVPSFIKNADGSTQLCVYAEWEGSSPTDFRVACWKADPDTNRIENLLERSETPENQYLFKVNTGGYYKVRVVADTKNQHMQSLFGFVTVTTENAVLAPNADQFRIGNPNDPDDTLTPVIVDPETGLVKIDGQHIAVGSIRAESINVDDLVVNGLATMADAWITGDLIVDGTIDASHIEAYSITTEEIAAGTISAYNIASEAITTDKLDVGAVTAVKIASGTITAEQIAAGTITAANVKTDEIVAYTAGITGALTIVGSGSITLQDGTIFASDTSTIAGWEIGTDVLRSNPDGNKRIELDHSKSRISIIDSTDVTKVAMGYLNDLVNPTTGEIYTVEDYGFWVLNGNKLTIDGDIDYVNGNHLIKNDASYKIVNAIGDTVARFGTDNGEMGIFVYPSYSPNPAAKFTSDEIFIGAYGEDDNFLSYDQSTGILSIKGNIDLSGSFVIQEQVNYVPKKTWSDPTALADFTYENCTPTDNDFYTTITSSYATAYIKKDGLSLDGAKHNKIRIRMRYNAEKHIRVQIRYKTTTHDYYDSYYAEAIHSTNDWFTFEVDMSSLTNASPDYVISTITGFQIAITYCDYLTYEQGLYLNDNEIVTDVDTFYPVDIAWITIGGLTADILTERGIEDGADVTESSQAYLELVSAMDTLNDVTIPALEDQIDSSISTWFGATAPTLSNAPAVDWTTDALKDAHLGDLYYVTSGADAGKVYRFLNDPSYAWLEIDDTQLAEAISLANDAYNLAENKNKIYTSSVNPTNYNVGDLWTNGDVIKRCLTASTTYVASHWEIAASMLTSDITDDAGLGQSANWAHVTGDNKPADNADVTADSEFVITTYPSDKNVLQTQIDGKIQTWFQSTDPNTWTVGERASHDGDMWFNDDENERILQRYNASENAWELVRDQIAVDAYYDAVTAQEQAMFVPKVSWTDNTALTDFTLIGGDITADIGYSTITSTTGVVYLTNEDFSIDGERYKTIGIRVRYDGPKNLRLLVRYKTAEHDYTNTYMAEGFYYDDGWHTVSLDMASLVAGGTDYTDSTITGIQLEISFCNYITTESGSYIEDDELVTDEVTFYPLDIAWIAIGSLTLDILNERGVSDGADVTGENTSADTEYLNGILTAQLFGNLVPEGSGLFVDGNHMGYHSETSWKTYMDSSGHFYLSGDGTHGLAWDGTTLNISGSIAIQNPTDVRTALNVAEGADVTSENTAADTELLNGLYTSTLFGTTVPAGEGLFIDGTHLGYHDGVSWKTYMDNGGNFYLSGSGTHGLAWDGETLSVTGNVLVQNPSTVRAALNVADGADVTGANTALDTSLVNGTSASTVKAYAINGNTAKGYTDAWKYGSTTYINGGNIHADSSITIGNTVNGDYCIIDSGDIEFWQYINGAHRLGKSLKRIESGVGNSNTTVTLPGYWKTLPYLQVSLKNTSIYNKNYPTQNQGIECYADNLSVSSSGICTFVPRTKLVLTSSSGNLYATATASRTGLSDGDDNTHITTSSQTTPNNTVNVTVTARFRQTKDDRDYTAYCYIVVDGVKHQVFYTGDYKQFDVTKTITVSVANKSVSVYAQIYVQSIWEVSTQISFYVNVVSGSYVLGSTTLSTTGQVNYIAIGE